MSFGQNVSLAWVALPLCALGLVGVVVFRALNKPNQGKRKKNKRKGNKGQSPYTGSYDPKKGLGRGAPGFQTNIQRVSISPALAARIRTGEDVSADEVTRDLEQQQKDLDLSSSASTRTKPLPENVDPDWLPASITQTHKKRR